MRIWLLKDGENLPVQSGVGKMRTWKLAHSAALAGHDVTWWSSTHSHQLKKILFTHDHTERVDDLFDLRLLHVGGYTKNRSFARVHHHRQLATRFIAEAGKLDPPDIIVASYPIIGFAQAAIDYARDKNIPVVVDIRDPWPDVFRTLFPSSMQWFGELVVKWFDRQARRCLSSSTGIVAVSEGFLTWALAKAGIDRRPHDRVFYIGGSAPETHESFKTRQALFPHISNIDDKVIITFVGSFGFSYQLGLIGDLARRLHQEGNHKVHFVLVGDGMQREAVERYSAELPNVEYMGWQDAATVRQVLNITDVGIAPYNVMPGCMPNKVCEYLALGLPVLNSTIGDLPPLLEEYQAGFSYAPDDLDHLHQHVVRLSDDDGLVETLKEGARKLFDDRFVAEKIYPEYVTYLQDLALGNVS